MFVLVGHFNETLIGYTFNYNELIRINRNGHFIEAIKRELVILVIFFFNESELVKVVLDYST